MPIVTRENVRLPLHTAVPREGTPGETIIKHQTVSGTLFWDSAEHFMGLVDAHTHETILHLTPLYSELEENRARILDVVAPNRIGNVHPEAAGALYALRIIGAVKMQHWNIGAEAGLNTVVEVVPDLGVAAQAASTRIASVTLFKDGGKYYTQEGWKVPVNAVGPSDMEMSPDFRRISNGAVLVDADAAIELPDAENWGFPHLIPSKPDQIED